MRRRRVGAGTTGVLAVTVLAAGTSLIGRAETVTIDVKRIFRCGAASASGQAACDEAREAILFNCTACHIFVSIVRKQAAPEEWDGTLARHRSRVAHLSDGQFQAIRDYLVANFGPDHEPPELPESLATQY